jgi:hypothetical protein
MVLLVVMVVVAATVVLVMPPDEEEDIHTLIYYLNSFLATIIDREGQQIGSGFVLFMNFMSNSFFFIWDFFFFF